MLADLADEIGGRPRRSGIERIVETGRDHSLVLAEQNDLAAAEGPTLLIQTLLNLAGRSLGNHARQNLGPAGVLLLAQIESLARRIQRVIESLPDLIPKPAVNAAIQELEREAVDDEKRRDDQQAENSHCASREARPRLVVTVIAYELPQLAREERRERDNTHDIYQQYPGLQSAEVRRILHTLGEEDE